METNTKEVPSTEATVSTGSFLVGALYISGLVLGVMFALWKLKIGADFRHVVGYSAAIVMLARLGVWFTANGPDPASSAFVTNMMLACIVASNLDVFTHRSQIPFVDIVICVLMINTIVKDVRRTSVALRQAVPVLLIQHIALGAGLYALYLKF